MPPLPLDKPACKMRDDNMSDATSVMSENIPMGTSYMTSEAAANLNSEKGLYPETLLLIQCVAKSIADNMLNQLANAADITHQHTSEPTLMYGRTSIDVFDKILREVFGHNVTQRLGIQRTIIVDIERFVDTQNDLMKELRRNNWNLIPHRLIQKLDRPISREASMYFAKELTTACKTIFMEHMAAAEDIRVRQLFVREQMMHRDAHGMDPSQSCCIFKLLEEDYHMPYDKCKGNGGDVKHGSSKGVGSQSKGLIGGMVGHMIVEFGIKCRACGGYHEFKVVR